jgi:hypothetical protein
MTESTTPGYCIHGTRLDASDPCPDLAGLAAYTASTEPEQPKPKSPALERLAEFLGGRNVGAAPSWTPSTPRHMPSAEPRPARLIWGDHTWGDEDLTEDETATLLSLFALVALERAAQDKPSEPEPVLRPCGQNGCACPDYTETVQLYEPTGQGRCQACGHRSRSHEHGAVQQPNPEQHAHLWRTQNLISGGSRLVCLECGAVHA